MIIYYAILKVTRGLLNSTHIEPHSVQGSGCVYLSIKFYFIAFVLAAKFGTCTSYKISAAK